jgi:hypothetical protein
LIPKVRGCPNQALASRDQQAEGSKGQKVKYVKEEATNHWVYDGLSWEYLRNEENGDWKRIPYEQSSDRLNGQ